MKIRSVSIALAGSVILAACADSPTAVQPSVRNAVVATNPTAGRYILVADAFGADFATKVAALGGSVETLHKGAGIAIVSGIADANAAKLATLGGITSVQPDAMVSLAAPVAAAEADASDVANETVESQANPAAAARYNFQWNMRQIGADKA